MTDSTSPNLVPSKNLLVPDPQDPNVSAVLAVAKILLAVIGSLLAGHGLIGPNNVITPGNWEFVTGTLLTIAPVAWVWWDKFRIAKTVDEKVRIAVQAALNFAQIAQSENKPIPTSVTTVRAKSIVENHS